MKLKGFLYAMISAIFFGSAGIFVKTGYSSSFSPVDLLILQYIIAGFLLYTMCIIRYKDKLKLSRKNLVRLIVQGAFGNTLMTVFFYLSFKYLDVAVATMLLFTYPAMVASASFILFKKAVSKTKVISIIGTFLGCILVIDIFAQSTAISHLGVAFGLLAAVFYSFMNIYAEGIVEEIPGLVITFYTTIFSLIVLLIFNYSFIFKIPEITTTAIRSAALLAFFCEIIPLTLLYEAIKRIGPMSTSIITSIEIPASALIAYFFLSERLSLLQVSGIVIVVVCVSLLNNEK